MVDILDTIERIAAITDYEGRIPLCDNERRLSRRQTPGDDNFKTFAEEVYMQGYNNRNNSGSVFIAGGQEQPIDIASVRRLAIKIHQLFPQKEKIKIKWVNLQ